MSAYVGVTGSLYEIHCGSTLRFTDNKQQSLMTTLGGRRVAQQGAQSRRVWDCTINLADASELARLQVLRQSVPMPWVFYSAWATRTNILTPDHASWAGVPLPGATPGSVVDLDGGGIGRSLNDPAPASGSRQFTLYYPVVPGVPVTAGVFARQSGASAVTLRITWRNAAGGTIAGATTTQTCATSGPLTRITVTATPPAGAVDCYLVATNHSVLAMPTLTFTSSPMGASVGAGCLTSVLDGIEADVRDAWAEVGGQRAGFSFTVTEVG